MKYWIILLGNILIVTLASSLTIFLWSYTNHWVEQICLVWMVSFSIYSLIKAVKIYSKINLDRKAKTLSVKTFFNSKKYELDKLTRWSESTNSYRVHFRKLFLTFDSSQVKLMSHADPENIDALYHYLRTHYQEIEE